MKSRQITVAVALAIISCSLFVLGQLPQKPSLEITAVPAFGEPGPLRGKLRNADARDYKIAMLIFIPSLGWYSKAQCVPLFTNIQSNGDWSVETTSGGVDQTAARFAVYLLPANAASVCVEGAEGLPPELERQSVAHMILMRTNPNERIVRFSGYDFGVKANTVHLGPGPSLFSDSPRNVWVDAEDRLHLRLAKTGSEWSSSEIISKQVFGYGTFKFQLDNSLGTLPENIVFGIFTWSDDPAFGHRELDYEFSRWNASGANSQAVVQPYSVPGNLKKFEVPRTIISSEHVFRWTPGQVEFESRDAAPGGAIFHRWTYSATVPPPADQNVRFNIWSFDGKPPSGGQEVEVVVKKFEFIPANISRRPKIETPSAVSAASGQILFKQLTVTDGTPPYVAWSASQLPPGVALDIEKGLILGTPTVPGVFESVIQVIDSRGVASSKDFQIKVASLDGR